MTEEYKLEHIGIVVDDMKAALQFYGRLFGFNTQQIVVLKDKIQKVEVAFIEAGGIKLELIKPISSDSGIRNFIEKGVNLYHLCYKTASIERALEKSRDLGGIVTVRPVPATAFNGGKIAFVYFKNLGLIEYLETQDV